MGEKGHVSICPWGAGSHGNPGGGAGLALLPGPALAPPLRRQSAHVYTGVPELDAGTEGRGAWVLERWRPS